jgi:hypothetical protein
MKLKQNIFLPTDLITKLKELYKSSTVTTIQRNLKSIMVNIYGSDKYDLKKLMQHNKIIEWLKTQPNTRITTLLFAIKSLLKVTGKTYKGYDEFTKNIWKDKKKNDVLQEPTEKELKKVKDFDFSNIKEYANTYLDIWENDKESLSKYEKMLITQFLDKIPPLRAQDYTNIKIVENEPEELINHINLSSGDMVLYDYKTNKYYGKREIELPEDLFLLIAEGYEVFENEWLFPKLSNPKESQTSKGITELIQRTLNNVNIGTQILRKLYVSNLIDNGASAQTLQRTAQIMAHSIPVQFNTYSSLSKVLHPN